ncbi:MAG: BTAD domain-containing putative transcriptional regulator [Acidimicrobiales bacterium]
MSSHLGVVEAGAGYGKSVLARQFERHLGVAAAVLPLDQRDDHPDIFVSSLGRALHAAKLSDLAAATDVNDSVGGIDRFLGALVETSTPLLVIVDDAHHLTCQDVAALVLRLARRISRPHRMLITARKLSPELEALRTIATTAYLDTTSLQFTLEEATELLQIHLNREPSKREARVVLEASNGWATALVLAATSGVASGPDGDASPAVTEGDPIAQWLRAISGQLDIHELRGIVQVAHLPMLTADVVGVSSGISGLFDRMVEVGVPLARMPSGWWEMPDPVSAYFRGLGPFESETAFRVAPVYEHSGAPLVAIRTLLRAGLDSDAASILAEMTPAKVEDVGLATLRDITDELSEEAVNAHPLVLLHTARVAETVHRSDIRTAALERAGAIIGDGRGRGDGPCLKRQIEAERARDLVWDERTRAEAKEMAASVVEDAAVDEVTAKLRALDVLGRLASWFSPEGPKPEAERLLEESARLADKIGQRTWRAQALIALAMGFYFGLCRFDRALFTIDEVLGQLPARSRYRALVQSFRGDVLVELGRYAEAEASIDEMREIGQACREEWALAYACWTEAELASYMGDRERTVKAVLEAESHRDVWYEEASGVEFLACVSDYLDRAGEHEMAMKYLARAQVRMAGCERPVRVFEAAILARSGDPEVAGRIIDALIADEKIRLEPQELWPVLLLRAYAALRRNDPDTGRLAAAAFDTCRNLGHPDGPLLRERVASEALLPYAIEAGSTAATALAQQSGGLTISLLGTFELRRGGKLVSLPPGRPARAVRAVASAGGRMHSEELLELLWPDADLEGGRNRLRNLLSRLKVASGEVLIRDQEFVVLVTGTVCDIIVFEAQAVDAMRAQSLGDHAAAAGIARKALPLYRGDLLTDDRMEWWSIGPRERLRNRYLELLDLLATDSERRGEIDEAVRLLQRATEVEPYDEGRYLRLARLLASQGRTGSAKIALARCRDSLFEVGVRVSPALESLERQFE